MIIVKGARSPRGGAQVIASEWSEVEKEDRWNCLYKRTSMLWQQTYLAGSSHTPSENMKPNLTGKQVSLLLSHEQVLMFQAQGGGIIVFNLKKNRLKGRGIRTSLAVVNIHPGSHRFYYWSPAAKRHQPRSTNYDPVQNIKLPHVAQIVTIEPLISAQSNIFWWVFLITLVELNRASVNKRNGLWKKDRPAPPSRPRNRIHSYWRFRNFFQDTLLLAQELWPPGSTGIFDDFDS